ncbi:hypothetical protein [Pasteuria penetrans]|uniref:hypothetical protein n=1 Tax=Pasteuria penetrans TaxID=86005 RepID=UPI0011F0892C|nr:hypothetical protein [Pasteuria penetrans]
MIGQAILCFFRYTGRKINEEMPATMGGDSNKPNPNGVVNRMARGMIPIVDTSSPIVEAPAWGFTGRRMKPKKSNKGI